MKTQPKTIIVFCPNWVGDVVMATPVFDCLRQNYPEAKLIGVIRRYTRGVIEDGPWFDRIIDCNEKTVKGFIALVLSIRRLKPDMAVILPNSFRSALIARLGNAKNIYGYHRNGRFPLLNGGPKPVFDEKGIEPRPMVQYYMELCRFLTLNIPGHIKPNLFFSPALAQKGKKLLNHYNIQECDMVIGINPGAKFGSSKCWSPEYFARLAELFEKKWQCKILLFVGPGEEKIARSIVKNSTANIIDTGPDHVDLSLLKCLIKRCQLLVTNDTGTRHYGVAFDIPVVVIMGSTDPRYTASNLEKTLVLRKELDCSPCHKPICPLDHHDCMQMIKPEDVLQGSIQLMENVKAL